MIGIPFKIFCPMSSVATAPAMTSHKGNCVRYIPGDFPVDGMSQELDAEQPVEAPSSSPENAIPRARRPFSDVWML